MDNLFQTGGNLVHLHSRERTPAQSFEDSETLIDRVLGCAA
jgi:hypothetical protein